MVKLKADESRTYVVPLRKGFLKTPKWRRSKKAIRVLREFLLKHTKADKVVLSSWINEDVWAKGSKNPPSKLKVKVVMKEEEKEVKGTSKKEKLRIAQVELVDLPARAARVKVKEEKKKSLRERLKEKLAKSEEAEEPEVENKEEKKQAKVSKSQELKMRK